MQRAYYRHVAKAEKTGEREITFTFDSPGNRELPKIIGQLTVLPKHWWEGTDSAGPQARHHRDHAGDAAWVGPLSGQGIRRRPVGWRSSASRITGARTSPSMSARTISTKSATNIFATTRRAGGVQGRPGRLDHRERSAKQWATRYDFPAVARQSCRSRRSFRSTTSVGCRAMSFNLRRRLFKDVRLRRAFNYAFDFEEMNKQLSIGAVQAQQQLLRRARAGVFRLAGRPGTANSRNRARQGAGRSFHHAISTIRSAAIRNRCAAICARRAAVEGGRLRNPRPQAGRCPTGKPVNVEFLVQDPFDEADRCSTSPSLERSASRSTSAPSMTRNIKTACAISISTSSPALGRNRCRPATSSANSGDRRRRIGRARETSAASRIPRSTR